MSAGDDVAAPYGAARGMSTLVLAMRPQEWVKNLLVFAGLIFSGQLDEGGQVADATLAFAAFCAISSAGYLFNDLRDRDLDRRHPDKRHRPIASGALAEGTAWVAAVVLVTVALALGFAVEPAVAGLVGLYAVTTVAYSVVLKRVVIL